MFHLYNYYLFYWKVSIYTSETNICHVFQLKIHKSCVFQIRIICLFLYTLSQFLIIIRKQFFLDDILIMENDGDLILPF